MDGKAKKPFYKKWWIWLIAAALLGAIINFGELEETPQAQPKAPKVQVAATDDVSDKEEENNKEPQQKENVKPTKTPKVEEKIEEVIVISVQDLYNAYQDNEVAADLKYKHKMLEVTGVISDFGVDVFGTAFIKFDTGKGPFNDAQVFFKKGQEEKISELSKGETITFVGKGGGLIITSVVINKAELK